MGWIKRTGKDVCGDGQAGKIPVIFHILIVGLPYRPCGKAGGEDYFNFIQNAEKEMAENFGMSADDLRASWYICTPGK